MDSTYDGNISKNEESEKKVVELANIIHELLEMDESQEKNKMKCL